VSSATDVINAYWVAADVMYEGPQTRERVHGPDNYVLFNVEGFPGK